MPKPSWRILIIADDKKVFLHVQEILNEGNENSIQLEWAPSSARGLEGLRSGRFDGALVDAAVQPGNGLDFLREAAAADAANQNSADPAA